MTQATQDCTGCPVSAGTHKPADAVHLISEPAAALVAEPVSRIAGGEQTCEMVAACDSAANLPAPAHPAEGVPAPVAMGEREAFEAWARDYGTWEVQRDDDRDLGTTGYTDVSLTVAWHAAQARAALAATPAAPAAPAAVEREDFAWLVVQEACETEPADEDDPECIRILRRDLKSAVLAAFLRGDAPPAAVVPAAAPDARRLIGKDHKGTRVDYSGMLGQVQREIKRSAPGYAEMIRQLKGHLQELGQGWYAGNTGVVDEFLQLYCVESEARAAIAAQAGKGVQ